MAKIKILIQGYAREEGGKEFASSTTVLIQNSNKNIIVDPGMNKQLLLEALAEEDMPINKIDYVVLTHTHLNHCLLAGIFENAKIIDDSSIYSFDGEIADHDYNSLMALKDPYMKNKEELIKSRKQILSIADYVIPGHGKMFRVEK